MKEFRVDHAQNGQKCIKYCEKILPNAGSGFLHKMMRKKNITVNGKKTEGNDRLKEGDIVRFFFSDETFAIFASGQKTDMSKIPPLDKDRILYEDDHVLFYNKPSGVLSQKAKPEDISLNEMLLSYLSGKQSDSVNKPSICNRLDRNTSGIVICGKTYAGLSNMNRLISERKIGKYYRCLVYGRVKKPILLKGYLKKDEKSNQVEVKKFEFEGASYIETEITPIAAGEHVSLLEVHLITGKTHQIRAHLASLGHGIVGDYKYANRDKNEEFKKKYSVNTQMLHAYRIEFPKSDKELTSLSGMILVAPFPEQFVRIQKEEIHGYVEF